jgi:tape measure domain-containing protein
MPTESVHWAVTSDAAKVYREDLKAAKALDAGIDRLAASLDNGSKASKRLSASILKAGEALKQERRIAEATVKITKEWGVSTATAAKVARRFRGEVDALSPALKREAKALDLAQKETRELAAAQRKAAAGAKAMNFSLGEIAAIAAPTFLAAESVRVLVSEVTKGVQAFIQMEGVIRSLNVATGGTAQGADALAFVRAEADRLGLSLATTSGEFGKLNAAAIGTTLQGEGVRNIFSAVSEASSVLGLSSDQTSGALTALGQIMSKGTVQAEELRGQLGERIPGAFQIMARGLGVTTQKLGKMLERGEVLAEDALPAFAAELRRAFGTDATTRIETTAATFARLETAVFDLRAEIGRLSVERGGLGDIVNNLAQMIQVATNTIRVVDDFVGSVDVLGERFRLFNDKALRIANKGLKAMLGTASEAGGKMAPAVQAVERYAEATEKAVPWAEAMTAALDDSLETLTGPLADRLGVLRERIAALGDAQQIRAEAEAQANRELDESLSRIEASRQALLNLEIQALSTGEAFDTLADRDRMPEVPDIGDGPAVAGFGAFGIPIFLDSQEFTTEVDDVVADMRKKMFDAAEDIAEKTEEEVEAAWWSVAEAAFSVADAIGGEWGGMLGGLIDGIMGVRESMKGLQGTGGLQALTGGFGLGQQAGGLVAGLGIGGPGQAGGLLSGIFGAAGTAAFGPVGGLVGGMVGELVGSLKIFQEGGDTATAAFEVNAGRLEAVTTKLEGDLGQGIEAFSGAVAKSINAILASLGAFFGPGGLADIDIKIRQEGDETLFQVRRFGKTFAKFKDEAQAVTAAIQTILSESDIQGLSENVAAAIRNTTAQTFDQLAADISRAQLVDERLMTEGQRFLAARERALREEINALSDLGVSMDDVLEGLRRQEEALARQAELRALSTRR